MKNRKSGNSIVIFKSLISTFLLVVVASLSLGAECQWSGIEKIIAVGDLHGDYRNFVRILKGVGLVGESLHWTGGKTHLVQTGDVLDRGPDAKKIFDLIKRLEVESAQAGGMVHMLIGNHEEMNITGIAIRQPRYVGLDQFLSFLPAGYVESKEKERRDQNKKEGQSGSNAPSGEDGFRNFWTDLLRNNKESQLEYTLHFNDTYGRWIIEHNAVIKINRTIFVHGGISRKYSLWRLEKINGLLRTELDRFRIALKRERSLNFKPEIVYASDGPLWYRGLAKGDESFHSEVESILKNLQAERMVIAHTPQRGSRVVSTELMSRYEGKVWIIDTGISEAYGGFISALILEGDQVKVWGEGSEYQ